MTSSAIRVLLVEDDPDDHAFIRAALADIAGRRIDLHWAKSYEEAQAAIAAGGHDVFLFDYRLGVHTGLDLLRETVAGGCRTPIILLTGQGDREVDLEAMRAGAADYLSKERLEAELLERSIRYAMAHKRTEEELRHLHDELEKRVEDRTAALAYTNRELHAEVVERQKAERQLKASLQEKEVLLRELHHRVKNNLQVISSLLQLQSRHVKDPRALELFKESQNRVRSMGLIHEKLYRSRDLARIDMADYVRNLTDHLLHSYGFRDDALTLDVAIDDVRLSIDTVVPCGLLIHELVSNALKHAFPERRGAIRVELRVGPNGRYTLAVSDDGVGIPETLDYRESDSLGLQLVTALAEQLDGDVTLDRERGTTFTIVFGATREETAAERQAAL